jgi:hypothetical protein
LDAGRINVKQLNPGPAARQPDHGRDQNSTRAMKKISLAISMDAPARPPKPRTPAISAIIRNVTTQLSMVRTPIGCGLDLSATASAAHQLRK